MEKGNNPTPSKEDNWIIREKYGINCSKINGEYIASITLENMKSISTKADNEETAKLLLSAKLYEFEEKERLRKYKD